VEKIIKKGEADAAELIEKNKTLLAKIADTLVKKETIEKEEFEQLIKGDKKK
jgi:ATP-dependent Zn protease